MCNNLIKILEFMNMKLSTIKYLSLVAFTGVLMLGSSIVAKAYADSYGGEDTETKFKIVKDVKLDGDDSYKDKVFVDLTKSSEKGRDIIFRVRVTNLGDDADDMEMKDSLPDELNKIAGDLIEEWDDFENGEVKEFTFRVKIKDSEIKSDKDYEKCVVNKAELRQDGDFQGSDTATVCYGNVPVKELPKTGFTSMVGFAGM